MKSQKEIYKALLDGKKIKFKGWVCAKEWLDNMLFKDPKNYIRDESLDGEF